MRVTSALRYNQGMTYQNLTPAMLAHHRDLNPLPTATDGTWLNWPHSTKPKKPKKGTRGNSARYHVAKALKRGSGRYS